ncbi:MAG: hypothetical protein LBS11_06245 [Oscillospiraceae bacterium]|jgi:hypothetical protein|nr:hypothetical protein [Oscillospiraceae bacterium]
MNITHKQPGGKIPFNVSGAKITFDDELTLNLAKYERDDPTHIDVCYSADGFLVASCAGARKYVAEIDIPAREYIDAPLDESQAEVGDGASPEITNESGGGQTQRSIRTPVGFNADKVTLTLWAV